MLLAMFVIMALSFLWTQYSNPGIRKLAGVKQLLRNAADEMTLVLTDVEGTQALSQWNPGVSSTFCTPQMLLIFSKPGVVANEEHSEHFWTTAVDSRQKMASG